MRSELVGITRAVYIAHGDAVQPICETFRSMAPHSSDPAVHSGSQRPKVLYVMGAGRSGSTILGVTLGNCADVFYAGELDKWLLRSGKPKLAGARRTEFWDSVREGVADPGSLLGGEAHRYLERSSSLFRIGGRSVRRRIRERYRRIMTELYRAVATTSGSSYVVDSSHYPLRARELQSLSGIDLYILWLVRDPRKVIASFAREDVVEPRFNATTTRAYLLLTHALAVWVFLKQPPERRIVISHEEFLEDPKGILRSLLDHVGSSAPIPDLTSLSTGIPLQGNRLIHKDVVSLERREGSADPAPRRRLLDRPLSAGLSRLGPRARTRPPGNPRRANARAPASR
jgi:hypothetical protein